MTGRARWAKRQLDYSFSESALLDRALTHRSASKANNERLEFLGDAMLGLSVARQLYASRPDASEGDLSRARAALVNKRALAEIGRAIGIDDQLVLGPGESRTGGAQRDSILADAVEAVIGAVVLDGGFEAGDSVARRLLAESFATLPDSAKLKDPKTRLQEWLQARGQKLPSYRVDEASGSEHNLRFDVSCRVEFGDKSVVGHGSSRRRAEQAAAEAMLIELERGEN